MVLLCTQQWIKWWQEQDIKTYDFILDRVYIIGNDVRQQALIF